MKLNLADKKVIQAFFNKTQSDGLKLLATWGEQVAEWKNDQIIYNTESKKTKQILEQVKALK